jgi:hypothetical protein
MFVKVILSIVITKYFCFASLAEENHFAIKCRFSKFATVIII